MLKTSKSALRSSTQRIGIEQSVPSGLATFPIPCLTASRRRPGAADRQKALDFGAQEFVGLDSDALEDVGSIDLVLDVIGGDIQKRSARLIRAGGTLVSVVGPTEARPADGLAVDFVVEADRAQLIEIVERVRDGRLRTNIGNISTLDDAVAA